MAEKEYIERGALVQYAKEYAPAFSAVFKIIALSAPAADVVEVRHGEWKKVYQNKIATVYECSNCQHLSFGTSKYCICGAKMDGERKEQK